MRILVIEDDDDNRETLANVLTKSGHTVETAVDGLQALDKICKARPDLAIVDLSLPDINGRDVLSHLDGIPAIVWSGVTLGDEEKFPSVVAVVPKPNTEKLLEEIERVGRP